MKISKGLSRICALIMCLFLTNLPAQALAEAQMIQTQEVVAELSRQDRENQVQGLLNNEEVRKNLLELGLTPDEVSSRLATLSDVEMKQLSSQLEQARYGGDILVTILVVVLIIFLIKRI